jgi:hypothetical protein
MSHTVSQITMLPSIELLLIAGRAVALVLGLLIFAWAFRHWRRAAMNDAQRVFEQLDLVRSELLIMKEVMHHAAHRSDSPARSAAHDGRTHATNSTSGMTAAMQSTMAPNMATMGNAVRGYEIAARMARNGADKDELMRSCGITSHEAELLIKLHGHRRDSMGRESAAQLAAQTAAGLINRQPRMPDSRSSDSMTRDAPTNSGASHSGTNKGRGAEATRQAATAGRQSTATTETQRTTQRAPNLPPRSRLVAVG